MIEKKLQSISIGVIVAMLLISSAIIPSGSIAFAQQSQNTTSKTLQFSNANFTSLLKPGNTTYNTVLLDAKMLQLAASNKPKDIATLAYVWGFFWL